MWPAYILFCDLYILVIPLPIMSIHRTARFTTLLTLSLLPISYLGMLIQQKESHPQPGNINDLLGKHLPDKKFKTPCTEEILTPPRTQSSRLRWSMLMQLMLLATCTVCALVTKRKEPREPIQSAFRVLSGTLQSKRTWCFMARSLTCSYMRTLMLMVLTLGHFCVSHSCTKARSRR